MVCNNLNCRKWLSWGKLPQTTRWSSSSSASASSSWASESQTIRQSQSWSKLQCRGWGTDLVPPHMSQIYNQQMTLAEQVETNFDDYQNRWSSILMTIKCVEINCRWSQNMLIHSKPIWNIFNVFFYNPFGWASFQWKDSLRCLECYHDLKSY